MLNEETEASAPFPRHLFFLFWLKTVGAASFLAAKGERKTNDQRERSLGSISKEGEGELIEARNSTLTSSSALLFAG